MREVGQRRQLRRSKIVYDTVEGGGNLGGVRYTLEHSGVMDVY